MRGKGMVSTTNDFTSRSNCSFQLSATDLNLWRVTMNTSHQCDERPTAAGKTHSQSTHAGKPPRAFRASALTIVRTHDLECTFALTVLGLGPGVPLGLEAGLHIELGGVHPDEHTLQHRGRRGDGVDVAACVVLACITAAVVVAATTQELPLQGMDCCNELEGGLSSGNRHLVHN